MYVSKLFLIASSAFGLVRSLPLDSSVDGRALLEKRQYTSELRNGMAYIGERWVEIGKLVDTIPKTNGSGVPPESTKPVTDALWSIGNYIADPLVRQFMKENGAFTNKKEADEFIADLLRNGPAAVKAMSVLLDRVPQVQDIGKTALLSEFNSATSNLAWAYGGLYSGANNNLLKFIGNNVLDGLESPNGQLDLVNRNADHYSKAYAKAWWDDIVNGTA